MENIHHQRLLNNIGELMDSKEHTDFVIICEGQRFDVHKAIMCSASAPLAAAFRVNMKEANTGEYEHKLHDADTVKRMISYIYKTEYEVPTDTQVTVQLPRESVDSDVESVTVSGVNARLIAHTRMYAIGDYYQLPTLKVIAKDKFASCVEAGFETDGFIHVIREVNKHIDQDDGGFQDALRTIALTNTIALTQDDTFMNDLFELGDVRDFATGMLRQIVGHQILDKAAHAQELLAKDAQLAVKASEAEQLKSELAMEKRNGLAREDRIDDIEGVMQRLVDDVESLPSQCRNSNCRRELPDLTLRRKGHPKRGAGEGDWEVKCGRCQCRLCK